jgi:hypothetical protein
MTYINCLLTSSQQVQFKMDCACPQLSPACVMLLPVYEKNVIAVINISCLTNSAAWSFLGPNNNYIHYWQQYQHSPAPEACAGACLVLSFRTCHSHSNAADVVTSLSRWLSVQSKSKHIYIYIYMHSMQAKFMHACANMHHAHEGTSLVRSDGPGQQPFGF